MKSNIIIWSFLKYPVILGCIFIFFISFKRISIDKTDENSHLNKKTNIEILLKKKANPENKFLYKNVSSKTINEPILMSIRKYIITFGTGLLIAFSCLCLGAFIGFLFGIPRISKTSKDQVELKKQRIFHNDNLVEISDWLTKIIVGVGLTQIQRIPEILNDLGNFLGPSFRNQDVEVLNTQSPEKTIAISITLYFVIVGFMSCYLWTRFGYAEMLRESLKNDENDNSNHFKIENPELNNGVG